MRRLARAEPLGRDDYEEIATQLAAGNELTEPPLRLNDMPGAQGARDQVSLKSIEVFSSVNALVPGQRLEFPDNGLVVVYGDNGSGKSGFARLLKDVARSRHREDVLSDIFSDKDRADRGRRVFRSRARSGCRLGDLASPLGGRTHVRRDGGAPWSALPS